GGGRRGSARGGRHRRAGRRAARRADPGPRRVLGRESATGHGWARGRADLLARGGGLRAADRGLRRARLHPEVEALGGGVRRARRMTPSTVVASSHTRTALRDPVLVLPFVVAAGLGIGWLGSDAKVSGTRVAVDLALAWALVGASLLALGRARWRRSRFLLMASAFALLAADLRWARADSLWTLGFLLELLWL